MWLRLSLPANGVLMALMSEMLRLLKHHHGTTETLPLLCRHCGGGKADIKVKIPCAENLELSQVLSFKPAVAQTVARNAESAASDFAFPVHSTSTCFPNHLRHKMTRKWDRELDFDL